MNLRTARRLKDITQAQLADAAGVDPTTISDIERGKNTNPSWSVVKRISDALGVEPDEIFPLSPPASEAV